MTTLPATVLIRPNGLSVEEKPEIMAIFQLDGEVTLYLPFIDVAQYREALQEIKVAPDDWPVISCAEEAPSLVTRKRLICVTAMPYEEWEKQLKNSEI